MSGTTTAYSRIRAVLVASGAGVSDTAEELGRRIVRRAPACFVYHRRDRKTGEVVPQCSENAVRSSVRFAIELGLLGESGRLTAMGKEASDPERYEVVVRRQAEARLRALGCPVSRVEAVSREMLRRPKITVPTAGELYAAVVVDVDGDVGEMAFKRLLRLLATCGGLGISRREMYYPIVIKSTRRVGRVVK